ncbi:MAG TPA: nicotinamide riboside transporter PnuC, partial [Spirochaetota bacterium]|nr:nicotinamide riboside transporter PnuC [Spirochaetota bacterium]
LMKNIHFALPKIFPNPASFPFGDAFTTIMSINAQIFMTHKKRESWLMWVAVDIVAMIIYFIKGIHLVAIEYIIFGIISVFGFYSWNRSYCNDLKESK